MTIWIDPPKWPAHGTVWAHVVSDSSLSELHDFAARAGLSPRGFDADHYDVPSQRVPALIAVGARTTSSRDLLRRLTESGLRVPKRKGERVLATVLIELDDGPAHRELIASAVAVATPVTHVLIRTDTALLIADDGSIPTAAAEVPVAQAGPLGYERLRPLRAGRGTPVQSWVGARSLGPTPLPGMQWLTLGEARDRWGGEPWWELVGRAGG